MRGLRFAGGFGAAGLSVALCGWVLVSASRPSRLAEAIVTATGRRLVIGIDEPDKTSDEEGARKLLDPPDVMNIAAARGRPVRPALARLLRLLCVGNVRELIRLADGWPEQAQDGVDERLSERGLDQGDCLLTRRVRRTPG
jgi:hypothetical protein